MDKDLVCKMYKDGKSMRCIALEFDTNHKLISRILKGKNIQTRKSLGLRGKTKFDCDKTRLYNNMATHLRFDVSIGWLAQFEDFEKLKVLNKSISKKTDRFKVDTEWYKLYIHKFYYDNQFNDIYKEWIISNYEMYKKPSIDHIIPRSKGGENCIENLQFLSWFENRCKNDMTQNEWDFLKNNIKEYLI